MRYLQNGYRLKTSRYDEVETLTIKSIGGFAFAAKLNTGDSYDVVIQAQPAGQSCTLSNASGVVAKVNISNIKLDGALGVAFAGFYLINIF